MPVLEILLEDGNGKTFPVIKCKRLVFFGCAVGVQELRFLEELPAQVQVGSQQQLWAELKQVDGSCASAKEYVNTFLVAISLYSHHPYNELRMVPVEQLSQVSWCI